MTPEDRGTPPAALVPYCSAANTQSTSATPLGGEPPTVLMHTTTSEPPQCCLAGRGRGGTGNPRAAGQAPTSRHSGRPEARGHSAGGGRAVRRPPCRFCAALRYPRSVLRTERPGRLAGHEPASGGRGSAGHDIMMGLLPELTSTEDSAGGGGVAPWGGAHKATFNVTCARLSY